MHYRRNTKTGDTGPPLHLDLYRAIRISCSYCFQEFRVSPSTLASHKRKEFFCCREHWRLYAKEHSSTYGKGYHDYIYERDRYVCVLCRLDGKLDVHHIVFRSQGGTDEYHNLVSLCRKCHHLKAHGVDASYYKEILLNYVSAFDRPDLWDNVMERSRSSREKVLKRMRSHARRYYQQMKGTPRYQAYREQQKKRRKERDAEFRRKHGCSYMVYRYRQAKVLKAAKNAA